MDAFIDLSWRAYPAGLMMAVGIAVLARGMTTLVAGIRLPVRDRNKPIVCISGGRLAIVGMAVAGIAGAWVWHQVWLLALSLAIGGEELLESSVVLYVLRWGRRVEARQAAASRRGAPAT